MFNRPANDWKGRASDASRKKVNLQGKKVAAVENFLSAMRVFGFIKEEIPL
jgi:hypothetical protein